MVDYYFSMQQPYYQPVCDSKYSQQEEEWDRDALLDPAWERQQKKTFTAWCNSHLRKAGTSIEVLEEDFQSGLKLMLLLEVISGEILKKPDRGKMRFHKIANVNKALQYIESKGVKLVSIGAEEIVDGNVKMTLGLIWTIILRFAIQDINVGELSARDGLLLWCQRKTAPYNNVKISNFSTSWKDGLAFCALIHRHRPELIDYHQLNNNEPVKNLNLAFEVAEKYLDIPKMLDAEVMANTLVPDEKTIMTYVSSYYYCFLDMNKAETAANRICRVLNTDRENKKLMEEYERLSTDILNWIYRWISWLSNRTFTEDETLESMRKKLSVFKRYRTDEKTVRVEEKSRLETIFNTLQTKLRLNNRPAFLPQHGHLIKDVNSGWLNLEESEKGFEEWLLTEMIRQERIEKLAEKFYQKCKMHEEWVDGKEETLKLIDYKNCNLYKIKALQISHEILQSDCTAHQERVEQICAILKELRNLGYSKINIVDKKCAEINEEWKQIKIFAANRRVHLDRHQRVVKELDDLHLNFANSAAPFIIWLDSVIEDLSDMLVVYNLPEIESLITANEQLKMTLAEANKGLKTMELFAQQIEDIIKEHDLNKQLLSNPYTNLSLHIILNKWLDLQSLIPTRERQLMDEKSRQNKIQQIQQLFIVKAENLCDWLNEQLQLVSEIEMGEQGNLESAIKHLKNILFSSQVEKANLESLEGINEELQENFALNLSSGSKYSMEAIRFNWQSLTSSINRVINQCENQMLLRDSKGITEEQLNEYRLSFNHFDKERKGLDEDQLRACLISIGYRHEAGQEISDKNMKKIMTQIDPNNLGRIPFESFADFMTRETADLDTNEQLIDSFRILANGKLSISVTELRSELPAEHAEYCIKQMERYQKCKNTDKFDYVLFSKTLYNA